MVALWVEDESILFELLEVSESAEVEGHVSAEDQSRNDVPSLLGIRGCL
jgi:hypothetical protein